MKNTRAMGLHSSTFQYLKPNEHQLVDMMACREAAQSMSKVIEDIVPDGPDKTKILRDLRTLAMWINVAITRNEDGSPREDDRL